MNSVKLHELWDYLNQPEKLQFGLGELIYTVDPGRLGVWCWWGAWMCMLLALVNWRYEQKFR